jgi:molybdopterin molybdotransferase
MQGHKHLFKPLVDVIAADGIQDRVGRRHYVRAHVTWNGTHFIARTTGNQGSHVMTSLLNANALMIVPEGNAEVIPGSIVKAIMLDWPEKGPE